MSSLWQRSEPAGGALDHADDDTLWQHKTNRRLCSFLPQHQHQHRPITRKGTRAVPARNGTSRRISPEMPPAHPRYLLMCHVQWAPRRAGGEVPRKLKTESCSSWLVASPSPRESADARRISAGRYPAAAHSRHVQEDVAPPHPHLLNNCKATGNLCLHRSCAHVRTGTAHSCGAVVAFIRTLAAAPSRAHRSAFTGRQSCGGAVCLAPESGPDRGS
jgi:hypothetical protein